MIQTSDLIDGAGDEFELVARSRTIENGVCWNWHLFHFRLLQHIFISSHFYVHCCVWLTDNVAVSMMYLCAGYRHVYLEGMEEASIFVHVAVNDITGKVGTTVEASWKH